AFVDFQNSGRLDLVISNGHVIRHPVQAGLQQRPVLLGNLGKGKFADMTARGGSYFAAAHRGRGLAVGDLDHDGYPDLGISNVNEPAAVLRNVSGARTPASHWLGVELRGADHRDVVGARVVVEVNGQRLTRVPKGGGS